MNLAQIARLLAAFALFFVGLMAVPFVVSLFEAESDFRPRAGFAFGLIVGIGFALLLRRLGRGGRPEFFRKEGLAVVGLAWLLAGTLGAVPFVAAGVIDSGAGAVFECVSGLTTTGATVLGTGPNPPIETLPTSVLLWRSMLQWIGGTGVILLFTVLLPALGMPQKNLLDSEAVGVSRVDQRPRMQEHARLLFRLYCALTLAAVLGYRFAGLSWFDSTCHAFTTMATGGFSTRNLSIGAYQNLGVELVAIVFMFLAGCNFALLLSAVRGRLDLRRIWRDPEFRTYTSLTVTLVVVMTAILWIWGRRLEDPQLGIVRDYSDPVRCLRDAGFQVVSILTSTGFGTANFQQWPMVATSLLLLCMLVGGCTGSTAGGVKVLRVLVCGKLIAYSLRLFVRPRAVQKLRIGQEVLPNAVVSAILTLVLLWFLSVVLGTLVLSLDPRLDPVSALSTSASMMGCTGPAITWVVASAEGVFQIANTGGIDVGPYGGYGDLHADDEDVPVVPDDPRPARDLRATGDRASGILAQVTAAGAAV